MVDAWGMVLAETIPGEQITASCSRCGWASVVNRDDVGGTVDAMAKIAVAYVLEHTLHCQVN